MKKKRKGKSSCFTGGNGTASKPALPAGLLPLQGFPSCLNTAPPRSLPFSGQILCTAARGPWSVRASYLHPCTGWKRSQFPEQAMPAYVPVRFPCASADLSTCQIRQLGCYPNDPLEKAEKETCSNGRDRPALLFLLLSWSQTKNNLQRAACSAITW